MKKLVLILVALLTIWPAALAEENIGSLPDSPFYGFKLIGEKFQLAFAGSHEKKAELHLKFAEKRALEAKEMADKGKPDKAAKAAERYGKEINSAIDETEKAQGIGKDVSQLAKSIEESTQKHIAVLQLVLQKVPEQAKPAIQKNIDKATEKQADARKIQQKEKERHGNLVNVVCTANEECPQPRCPGMIGKCLDGECVVQNEQGGKARCVDVEERE